MTLPLYLALTGAEMAGIRSLPPRLAHMACHFSAYGTGLSNRPKWLPEGSMLILNDRIPIHGHDPDLICQQLQETITSLHCSSLLLDFQRPGCEESARLARKLVGTLPCPVGLSQGYAEGISCPVFLPPPPLDTPLSIYLAPWRDHKIWLEAALDGVQLTLTSDGCESVFIPSPAISSGIADEALHCHYRIQTAHDRVCFTLYRTREDLDELMKEAAQQGVTQAIGLWQELN